MTDPDHIPGVLRLHRPTGARVPLVFDSPHSGLTLPEGFRPAVPESLVLVSADTWVGELFGFAPALGAPLLEALFPRSYLDLNRSVEDVDLAMLEGPWPHPHRDNAAARRGMGLVWRYAWGDTPMYDRPLRVAELEARIERFWRPYHQALVRLLDETHAAFGAVWHVDCHSMPAEGHALSPDPPGTRRADIVLGDYDGASCEEGFVALAEEVLRARGYEVARNVPFRGAELVSAYSDPSQGRHSLQIEINRRLYMDEATREKTAGFEALRADLEALGAAMARYAAETAGRGSRPPT